MSTLSTTTAIAASVSDAATKVVEDDDTAWIPGNVQHAKEARDNLDIWPLDEYNCQLLNEVHPRNYVTKTTTTTTTTMANPSEDDTNLEGPTTTPSVLYYDLVAIGSGAGGLVSSKQSARRGAKSALITEKLAGGDCLNVGCVPSKALIASARAVAQIRRASEYGIVVAGGEDNVTVDFEAVMTRLRRLRATIAPADGHVGSEQAGTHVYQGRGKLTSPNTVEVNTGGTTPITLQFKKCVLAMGGRPSIPSSIVGLQDAPYTTNESLFNLQVLPNHMIILGAGVIALEMAQSFARFGSKVTVINRSTRLFESKLGDPDAAQILHHQLEKDGVTFLSLAKVDKVVTIQPGDGDKVLPLMKVMVNGMELECDCLLVATGRTANVENCGLEVGDVQYQVGKGIFVNDMAQSISNPNIYAIGDCCANVPRLTHMSGEMAKLVVQNSLANDEWKLSSLVVPAVAYTEPEYATVGISSVDQAKKKGIDCDVYTTWLEHNDRAILESNNYGVVKIIVEKDSDTILGATIVAERAGEMINEVTLAMKNNLGLYAIGRNIHPYPTMGEAVMGCGIQYINKNLPRLDN